MFKKLNTTSKPSKLLFYEGEAIIQTLETGGIRNQMTHLYMPTMEQLLEEAHKPKSGDIWDKCHSYLKMYFNYLYYSYEYNKKVRKMTTNNRPEYMKFRYHGLQHQDLLEKLRNDYSFNDMDTVDYDNRRCSPPYWNASLVFAYKDNPAGMEYKFLRDEKNTTDSSSTSQAVRKEKTKNIDIPSINLNGAHMDALLAAKAATEKAKAATE